MRYKSKKVLTKLLSLIIALAIGFSSIQNLEVFASEAVQGLTFNGSSNFIELDKPVNTVPSTIEMKVKVRVGNKRQILFGNYNNGSENSFSVELTSDNKLRYFEESSGYSRVDLKTDKSTIKVGSDEWTNITLTRDPENKKVAFYQDGVLIQEWQNVSLAKGNVTQTSKSSIATDRRKGMLFDGKISEVRLWNEVKTLKEINDNNNKTLTGSEKGLSNLYVLKNEDLDGLFNIIYDKVQNGIDAKAYDFDGNYVSQFKGTGVDFSKKDIEVAAENKLSAAPKTVEAWIKVPSNFSSNERIGIIAGNFWDTYYEDIPVFNFEIVTGGRPRVYWKTENGIFDYIADGVNVCLGDWVHVAITLDDVNNKSTCYINGVKVNEKSVSENDIPNKIPNDPLKIGGDYRANNIHFFKGSIADVRVWSTVRSQEEIKENMLINLDTNDDGLMANWMLDKNTDGIFEDSSKFNNDAAIYQEWIESEFPQGDYSIAVIPDTQYLVSSYPDKFTRYIDWISNNAEKLNIKFTLNLGDIVDSPKNTTQWETAKRGLSKLDNKVPYVIPPGNHDMYNDNGKRDTTFYNKYFPYDTYSKLESFGGAFELGKMDNTYHYFNAGKTEYMIVALEFAPRDEVLEWANKIVAENQDKSVIVTTHAYLYHNGEWLDESGIHYPTHYFSDANNGDDIWEKFVSKHKNIAMVLSGHIGYKDLVVKTDIGANGNEVKQVLCDAQFMDSNYGGLGMIMLMTFNDDSE